MSINTYERVFENNPDTFVHHGRQFSLYECFAYPQLDNFLSESEGALFSDVEHSAMLTGRSGIGKSTFLRRLYLYYANDGMHAEDKRFAEEYHLKPEYKPFWIANIESCDDAMADEICSEKSIILADIKEDFTMEEQGVFADWVEAILEKAPDTAAVIACRPGNTNSALYYLFHAPVNILPLTAEQCRDMIVRLPIAEEYKEILINAYTPEQNLFNFDNQYLQCFTETADELLYVCERFEDYGDTVSEIANRLIMKKIKVVFPEKGVADDVYKLLESLAAQMNTYQTETIDLENDLHAYEPEFSSQQYCSDLFRSLGEGTSVWHETGTIGNLYRGRKGDFGEILWECRLTGILCRGGSALPFQTILRFADPLYQRYFCRNINDYFSNKEET